MYFGLQEAEQLSCKTRQHSSRQLCTACVTKTKHASPAAALSVAFAVVISRSRRLQHLGYMLAAAAVAAAVHAMHAVHAAPPAVAIVHFQPAHASYLLYIAALMQYLLLTDNVEKVPSNMFCDVGNEAASCAPGFFQLLSLDVNPLAPSLAKPHACCPGYFCPAMLTCMLPCPYGAICPRCGCVLQAGSVRCTTAVPDYMRQPAVDICVCKQQLPYSKRSVACFASNIAPAHPYATAKCP